MKIPLKRVQMGGLQPSVEKEKNPRQWKRKCKVGKGNIEFQNIFLNFLVYDSEKYFFGWLLASSCIFIIV